MDRIGYTRDHHWQCRAIISEWLESGDLQDAFRHQNPDLLSYTWRQDVKSSKAGRLDYILLSPGLISMMTECYHTHQPWSLTDHSSVTSKFRIEKTVQGPGLFRAMPGIEKDPVYDAEVRNLIQKNNPRK